MSSAAGGACLSIQVPPNGKLNKLDQKASQLKAFGPKSLRESAVCGEIGRIAALQGRPVIGSIQLLGDADPIDYGLPPEYREAIQKFHG